MTITIKGKEFEADFYDVSFIERYERSTMALQTKTAAVQTQEHHSTADGYRALIRIVDEFFDEIFGAGSAADIFAGKEGNVREHLEAVEELNEQAAVQRKGLNDITNRYTQRQAARAKPQSVTPFPGNQHHGKGKRRRK